MLSPIAKGIQSGHATSEMFLKYGDPKIQNSEFKEVKKYLMLFDWVRDHKTHISLNGGNSETMRNLEKFLENSNLDFPFSVFREDQETLEGILTSISIILPEKIYRTAELSRTGRIEKDVVYFKISDDNWGDIDILEFLDGIGMFSSDELELIELLNNSRLLGV